MLAHQFGTGGGIATHGRLTKEALARVGFDLDVLVKPYWPFKTPSELHTDDNVVTIPFDDVPSALRAREYDVVHVSSLPFTVQYGFHSLDALGLTRFPIIYTAHSSMVQEMDRMGIDTPDYQRSLAAQLELLANADRVIVPSRALGTALETPDISDKIRVVPNPVSLPRFSQERVDAIVRWIRGHFAPDGEELLVYSGRISQEKGVYALAHAYNHLKKRRKNLRLLYVGTGVETPLTHVRHILQADRNGCIKDGNGRPYNPITGWKDGENLIAYYVAADAVILPSKLESFGLSAAEALLMRKPLIVSNIDGLHEYFVAPGFAYGISDPDDILSIISAVNTCFDQKGTNEQKAMIDRAVAHLTGDFNLDRYALRTLGVYAESATASAHRRRYCSVRASRGTGTLESLLREDPTNAAILYQLAKSYLSNDDLEKALETLERAKTGKFKTLYGVEIQDVYVLLASVLYQQKKFNHLCNLFKEAETVTSRAGIEKYKQEVIRDWAILGQNARKERNYKLAEEYFNFILRIDPNNGNAHHRLAQIYGKTGCEADVRREYEMAFAVRAPMVPEEFMSGFEGEAHISGPIVRGYDNEVTVHKFFTPRILYTSKDKRRAIGGFVVKRNISGENGLPLARAEHSALERFAQHPAFQDEFKTPIPLAYDGAGTIVMEFVQGRNVVDIVKESPDLFIEYMEKIARFASRLPTLGQTSATAHTLDEVFGYSRLVKQLLQREPRYTGSPHYQRLKTHIERGKAAPVGDTFYFVHGDHSPLVHYDTGRELYCIDFNASRYELPSLDVAFIISNAYFHWNSFVSDSDFRKGLKTFLETYTRDMTVDQRALFSRQLPFFLAGVEAQKLGHFGPARIEHNVREVYGIQLP
jgi:glycosyltransferase involved in cell wall biosynthesis/Tfp pilus assembly protein PilF